MGKVLFQSIAARHLGGEQQGETVPVSRGAGRKPGCPPAGGLESLPMPEPPLLQGALRSWDRAPLQAAVSPWVFKIPAADGTLILLALQLVL